MWPFTHMRDDVANLEKSKLQFLILVGRWQYLYTIAVQRKLNCLLLHDNLIYILLL